MWMTETKTNEITTEEKRRARWIHRLDEPNERGFECQSQSELDLSGKKFFWYRFSFSSPTDRKTTHDGREGKETRGKYREKRD